MPDRVKAAVFSMLGAYYDCPGGLPPLLAADVFAGGGSMGLEALSRGARFCSMFERGPSALRALERNIKALDAATQTEIDRRDAWRVGTRTGDGQSFDLVFLDPPYRDSADTTEHGAVRQYLGRLATLNDGGGLVVLHHEAKQRFILDPGDAWRIIDERRFGSSAITLLGGQE